MAKSNLSRNTLTTQSAGNVSYVFPKSEEIMIPKSDLQIWLDKFKTSIRSSFSVFDALAILSLWAPIFTADFKALQITNSIGFEGVEMRAGYIVFAGLITLFIIGSRIGHIVKSFGSGVSADPEKMANKILELCQRTKK